MKSKGLSKLAQALRDLAAQVDAEKRDKCASILVAAAGLNVLNRKIHARKNEL